jgi:lipoate-protein ligase A
MTTQFVSGPPAPFAPASLAPASLAPASWRYVDSGALSGERNMACDLELAARMGSGPEAPPVLRFYRWQPWAISIGHHQALRDINLERCAKAGIDVVRRPTGGRAILHAEELTYCLVMPAGGRSVLEVYARISRALVRGLLDFGVRAALERSQPDFRAEYRKASSIPCFASSARYEIEVEGRKLVGSAQRHLSGTERDVVLQHGSILCGPAHRRLHEFLALDDPDATAAVKAVLESHTVDLAAILGREVDLHALTECLRRGFEQEWGVTMSPLTASECEGLANHA